MQSATRITGAKNEMRNIDLRILLDEGNAHGTRMGAFGGSPKELGTEVAS